VVGAIEAKSKKRKPKSVRNHSRDFGQENSTVRCLLPFILAISISSALADTLVFKDGFVLEGTILRENDRYLRLKTDKEELCIWKEDLKEQTKYDKALAEYRDKASKINRESADDNRALAKWCGEQGLNEEHVFHLEEVLRVSPADDEAGGELKLKKSADGKYVTERQAKEKEGLVRYFGEWMKKLEMEKYEKGSAKVRGDWKTKADCVTALKAEQAKQEDAADARKSEEAKAKWAAKVAAEDKAVKEQLGKEYRADYVDGFIVRTNVPDKDCKAFYRMMSIYRKQFLRDFGRAMGISYDTPINVYFFSDRDTYLGGVRTLDPDSMQIASRGSGFSNNNRGSIEESRIYLYKNDAEQSGVKSAIKWVDYRNTFYHELMHFFIAALIRNRSDDTIGIAINEGCATFFEGSVFNDKAGTFEWGRSNVDRLKAGRDGRKTLEFERLLKMSSAEFNSSSLQMTIMLYGMVENFVNYMMNFEKEKHRADLLRFMASYNHLKKDEKEPDRIKRLEKYIGIPLGQMQKECDEYTAKRKE
jgi:hypothetical protein